MGFKKKSMKHGGKCKHDNRFYEEKLGTEEDTSTEKAYHMGNIAQKIKREKSHKKYRTKISHKK